CVRDAFGSGLDSW
nr:immunoglobulin heavy chain junction region [Macaca mulatta]MOW75797.1 immunoglobulin heavy chain junction region [Macaca mulatta]MOW75926.1 immunoglobulin heavy chain junction region [Macaca mulatta]MOW76242.1 immunoglobulin heavy chain junction region [Macaca mulatta]MOW77209.1 immunoglobulin heavy chain junction region [Macaca mulatta]